MGGYKLGLYCAGAGSPTVVMDAGLGDSALVWRGVQPAVAAATRVCTYDRAGLGWSAASPRPRTSDVIVQELHTLLAGARVLGPYLLVGHSFGGLNMLLYAVTYPRAVRGLVLVDASSPDQALRSPVWFQQEQRQLLAPQVRLLTICRWLAPVGAIRLAGQIGLLPLPNVTLYPPASRQALAATLYRSPYCGTTDAERTAFAQSQAQVRVALRPLRNRPLGDRPLVVITHGQPLYSPGLSDAQEAQVERDWQALQRDLAHLSARSSVVIAAHSGHYIELSQPAVVSAAVRRVVLALRQGTAHG